MVQLFQFPSQADRHEPEVSAASWSAIGRAAELELAALLIERGHSVAQVLVDDGIDLVVDYSIKVQVKMTGAVRNNGAPAVEFDHRGSAGSRRPGGKSIIDPRVDLLVVKFRPTGAWWVIPRSVFGEVDRLVLGKKYAHYRDAWGLFSPSR